MIMTGTGRQSGYDRTILKETGLESGYGK